MNACHARPTPLLALLLALTPLHSCGEATVQAADPAAPTAGPLHVRDATSVATALPRQRAARTHAEGLRLGGAPPAWTEGLQPVCTAPEEPTGEAITRDDLERNESLPADLRVALLERADAWSSATESSGGSPYRGTLYTSEGPGGTLRVQCVDGAMYGNERQLELLVDPRTGHWTPHPLETRGHSGLQLRRNVALADLDGDGSDELCTEVFFHNGTVENRLERTWWSVNADLTLEPLLSLAVRDAEVCLDFPDVWAHVTRSLHRSSAGDLVVRIDVAGIHSGDPERTYGYLRLSPDPFSGFWVIVETWAADGDRHFRALLDLGTRG